MNMKKIFPILFFISFATLIFAQESNVLTPREVKDGWKLLFNGKDLNGWTSVGKDVPPSIGWSVDNGILSVKKEGDKRGGDIITKEEYSDFDFRVDFKLTKGGNSGIKYFFTKYNKGGWLGLEYQLLDDEVHPDGKLGRNGNRKTASLYDMLQPSVNKNFKPVGEWNTARIVSKGSKVTHYLNGKKVLSFDRKGKSYKDAFLLSKYKDSDPMFGDVKQGYILLQDHGDEVSFKNIKIKEL